MRSLSSLVLAVLVGLAASPREVAAGQREVRRSFSIPGYRAGYTRQYARIQRLLLRSWQRRQRTVVDVTFWGIDSGDVFTVYIKPDERGRWLVTEYVRHYQFPNRGRPETTTLIATGAALRAYRSTRGRLDVRLVTEKRKTVPLFEYLE